MAANRWLLDQLKSVPCTDCGQRYGPWVMEFDHVSGTKLTNMSQLAGYSSDRIRHEAAKCEVVCSNCHRQREHNRFLDRRVDAALDADLDIELGCDTGEAVSRFQVDTCTPILFQQRSLEGFSNYEIGRASLDLNGIRYRGKFLGTDANGLAVRVLVRSDILTIFGGADRGGVSVTVPVGTTTLELAAAVNRFAGSLVVAHALKPNDLVQAGSSVLAGGQDPETLHDHRYTFTAPRGVSGGLLFNFLNRPQVVQQIEGSFGIQSATPVEVDVVNLSEGFEPIQDEYGLIYCTTLTPEHQSFVISDAKLRLLPYRAIRVICAAPGTIRAQFQQAAE